MTYDECIESIRTKLPDGWRCHFHAEAHMLQDADTHRCYWASLYNAGGGNVMGETFKDMSEAYDAVMAVLDRQDALVAAVGGQHE